MPRPLNAIEASVESFVSDINQLLQRLCDADVEFVIVGGFAAVLLGQR